MNMKKCATVGGIVTGVIAIAATLGYAFDRPVWYRADFMPVAQVVTELAAESASSKLQRAIEQVERREAQIRRNGGRVEPQQVDDLRFWKQRVRELKRRLRKLDR